MKQVRDKNNNCSRRTREGGPTNVTKIANKSSNNSKNDNSQSTARQTRQEGPTNITKITKITNIAKIPNQASERHKKAVV